MSESLLQTLSRCVAPVPGRLVVGYSGGLDSTVLLHGLVRAGLGPRLLAVHVHHGLQAVARDWIRHCADTAAGLQVAFEAVSVQVPAGASVEAQARGVRRAALLERVPEDGALLLAHHQDDQAETLLLRLLRGAGPVGLGAMREQDRFADRQLLRPLLGWPRADLERVARDWSLHWVEDPTNQQDQMDRNFLRRRVLPPLTTRFPAVVPVLARGALLQQDAAEALAELAELDLARCGVEGGDLSCSRLLALSAPRRRNLLYFWLAGQGVPLPSRERLLELERTLIAAAPDRQPQLACPPGTLRRHRDRLCWLPEGVDRPLPAAVSLQAPAGTLGPWRWRWVTAPAPARHALPLPAPAADWRLGAAPEGARLCLRGRHRDLRELWREAGVPPWERRRLPVVLDGRELVAAPLAGVADGHGPARCWLLLDLDP